MVESTLQQSDLWVSGQGGFHTYRIPALIVTAAGTVLAFCEARRESASDHCSVHLLLRRSTDGGQTWQPPQCVYQDERPDEMITIGNPCPIVDHDTGTVFLLLTRNNQTVLVTQSDDDGQTWAPPRDITADVKPEHWCRYWTGPGHGLQLRLGAKRGRLIAPSYHTVEQGTDKAMRCHMVYSDDHGDTWHIGQPTTLADDLERIETNWDVIWHGCECMAVELPDGTLYLAIRNQIHQTARRAFACSDDGGDTWSPVQLVDSLPDPVCQASIAPCGDTGTVLFANPAMESKPDSPGIGRSNLTVRCSDDRCRTWSAGRVLHTGRAAYNDMAVLDDGTILCLYERGEDRYSDRLRLARFDLEWVRGT